MTEAMIGETTVVMTEVTIVVMTGVTEEAAMTAVMIAMIVMIIGCHHQCHAIAMTEEAMAVEEIAISLRVIAWIERDTRLLIAHMAAVVVVVTVQEDMIVA